MKFKIGDRVERITQRNSNYNGKIFEIGDTGIVKRIDEDYSYIDVKLDKNNYLFCGNSLEFFKLAKISSLKQFLGSKPRWTQKNIKT